MEHPMKKDNANPQRPRIFRTPHTPPGRPDETRRNVKAIVDRVMDPYGEHAEQKRREERDRGGK